MLRIGRFGSRSEGVRITDFALWSAHPGVYLVWTGGVYRYDIFAAYEAGVEGPVYDFSERDAEGREAFIDSCLELSVIETGIVPSADDRNPLYLYRKRPPEPLGCAGRAGGTYKSTKSCNLYQ